MTIMLTRGRRIARVAAIVFSLGAIPVSARFYIDYQGLDKAAPIQGPPDGYRVLADKTYGIVHEVGTGQTVHGSSFGVDLPLKEAILTIMPQTWIAYVDDQIQSPGKVSWRADNESWTEVLGRIGSTYGYRFIVDWDQKLLQISSDEDFTPPDYNDPVVLTDPESGRKLFVYPAKPSTDGGVIIVGGKAIPVKIRQ